ncbi:Monoglyceride lipase [Heracleum sosnowskyi]|uniref:Monoglyceride lipase n=1 Tax=Heracleum sosnowskyi TaxID=360622 RepID=A0AAD8HR56_9APIA|nr:Monoglyceride lipase [Heracleum sosnowskyi]
MESGNEMTAVMFTSGASGRVNALISLRAWRSFLTLINAFLLILLFPFRGRRKSTVTPPVSPEKSSHNKGLPAVRVPTNIVPWKSCSTEVAARRALAIRRVTHESAAEGESARDFYFFTTARGETLFTQTWTPVLTKTRGLVVLLHGLNEHSGRYSDFAKQLNTTGFKVYGMDWIGHGGSDGLHAYVHSLDDVVTDVKSFIGKVLADNPGLPCFCFGHSTGAAIILKAVLDPKIETRIDGVVVTSPAVGVQPSHPILRVVAPIFSVLLPTYQFGAANKQGTVVSRDPEALLAKYSDPLVYTGSIRVRTGYEILRISAYLQQNLEKLTVPFLVLHGSADAITDPVASQRLYKEASSADKSIKLFPGLLHDLLFEPERGEIVQGIIEWLSNRVQG